MGGINRKKNGKKNDLSLSEERGLDVRVGEKLDHLGVQVGAVAAKTKGRRGSVLFPDAETPKHLNSYATKHLNTSTLNTKQLNIQPPKLKGSTQEAALALS